MRQAEFARALLNPDAAVPDGLIGPNGTAGAKRFSVYRNNVAASLTRAMEAGFPVVRKLVGSEFFGAMALVFLRAHPPTASQIMLYGAGFAAFLERFPPVAHLPYLPDVARLEQALRDSYHAADAPALPHAALADLSEARLLAARLHLAPSLRLIRSQWPVHAIWLANTAQGPAPVMQAEDVVILRAGFDPHPHLLPPGGAPFLAALQGGATMAEALADAGESFDLAVILGLLLKAQAIVELQE